MHQFYRKLKTIGIDAYYWIMDYVYIFYWQTVGLIKKYDAKKYINDNSHKDPIILIPGVYESWQFMKPIADLLFTHGYSVHVVESLGYNTGSIEMMAERIQEYALKNHIEQYDIVAHSKGGLIAKYLLNADVDTIKKVITINTPFAGSAYARLFPLRSIRLFLPTSAPIALLAKDILSNKKITSIYSAFDPHIPVGSHLDGATNIRIKSGGHFRIIKDSNVHEIILSTLK